MASASGGESLRLWSGCRIWDTGLGARFTDRRDACHDTKIIDGYDVGVVQFCKSAGFALETFGEFLISLFFRRKDFERDDPIEAGLAGFIDGAHAAAAETLEDFELGK